MSEELKACPFCGKEMNDDNFFSCDGYPQACGCWEQTHTAQEAVDVWQSRPIEDALREEIKKLKEALEMLSEHCEELWGVVGADEGYDYLENWYERNPREEHAEIKTKVEEALK